MPCLPDEISGHSATELLTRRSRLEGDFSTLHHAGPLFGGAWGSMQNAFARCASAYRARSVARENATPSTYQQFDSKWQMRDSEGPKSTAFE